MTRAPRSLNRLHQQEVQFHWSGATEDAHHDLHLPALVVDLVHASRERTEWAVHDPYMVPHPKRHGRDRLGPVVLHLAENPPDLVLLERHGALARSDEPGHAGDVLDQ